MKPDDENKIWVAVKVERGFIVEVKGFAKKLNAEKLECEWRKKANPDYDESEVLPLVMGSE